ncbi:site-specific integrase [Halobacterium salinarum]|uniref:tyrosine-type recombinase/integrase n=2 Tax=Halobacterium salinarum TaxID=2242 RepID=UPI002552E2A6|nr:site-specific integrase [Halobacterium salinarum]MDL0138788.1 site-specific integrase [Halobacterium salinarum]
MTLEKPNRLLRCPGFDSTQMEPNRAITIVRRDQRDFLSDKAVIDYYDHRKKLLTWLLRLGKQPDKAQGYSPYTVCQTGHRLSRFDMWVWENSSDGYKFPPDHEDAKAYMEEVAMRDVTESTKGKNLGALGRYSKWLQHKYNRDEWEFKWAFNSSGGNNAPRDFLMKEERRKIRQAALEKDGTPNYGTEPELIEADPDSWKFTSLVWVSLDAGLRPDEVGNAKVQWCDPENGMLRIPREDSSKNEGNWKVGLTERTAKALSEWLDERSRHPRYEDTDKLWLTRHGNRYGSNELSRILKDLCDRAGITYENRQMSWYTIRHSVGTHMTEERDLAATKAQLRHNNPQTTMKYDNVPIEDIQNALDKMG